MKRLQLALYPLCLLAGSLMTKSLLDEPKVGNLDLQGFTIELSVTVPGTPEETFDLFTGDISPWWDHHFSQKPARFVIEPKPGGHFLELIDDEGNGLVHADVTWAERGKRLVFVGPLGLHGKAVQIVHTFGFEADGENTKLSAMIRGMGEVPNDMRDIVASVWKHFLIEQFEPYVRKSRG
ncbi:MAG: hypothetical protein RL885_09100 [Planctomycetota bacterium]